MNTVLVVDDDAVIVKMLTITLETSGYEVVTASNGEEALQAVLEEEPDLILLDIMMPVMDGLEMLEELRKTSQIPVIIISAFGDQDKVERARELGIECFLNKPFSMEILIEMLDLIFSF